MLITIRNQLTLQMASSIIVKCYFQIVTAKDFFVTAVTQSNSQFRKKHFRRKVKVPSQTT